MFKTKKHMICAAAVLACALAGAVNAEDSTATFAFQNGWSYTPLRVMARH